MSELGTYLSPTPNPALSRPKPTLSGTGLATADTVKSLTRPDGQMIFSHFTVSDLSVGVVEALKIRFQGIPNMSFEAFDIGIDAELQDLDENNYDLIIAAGVLHSTPDISKSLMLIRQLLAPSGRLLLQSLRPGLSWTRYVLGILPDWEIGEDHGRADEPYVDVKSWKRMLGAADLEIDGVPVFDSGEPSHISHVLVAKPQRHLHRAKKVTILTEFSDGSSKSHPMTKELLARGYEVSYCSLDAIPIPNQDIIALLDVQESFLEKLDHVKLVKLQHFIKNTKCSGILWMTQPSESQCADPTFAQIHGLARCIRSELGIAFATCRIDDMDSVRGIQAAAGIFHRFSERVNDGEIEPDFECVVEKGVTRVNRFFPVSSAGEVSAVDTTKDARLVIDQPGRLDTLHWEGETLIEPQEDEVQVEIYSAGLNFRDILVAMGIIELSPPTFGYEATGIVRRIGPKAGKFGVGDRIAITGFDVFASTVTTTEKLCEKLPDELDFTSGASMPLVFATAIYALINVGALERGQSVLIHSGCGGVGLAAIQLAQMIGAEVYTTVSSEEKIEFLEREFGIERDHIFNSRTVSFEADLLRVTKGKGVDLALNSLSGELLHATWRCIARWGTLVEIGKRDLLGSGKLNMEVFLANRSYRCVDIDEMCKEKPEMVGSLLRSMMDLFRKGHIRPISIDKIFPGSKMQEAFQHMQQGCHIGKIVVEIRETTSENLQLGHIQPSNTIESTVLDSSASYLLVGGLGGLGRSAAVWIVQHGARTLTFLSRNAGTTNRDKLFVKELQSMGCKVHLVRGSVTEAADVARAVVASSQPLKGILQMTMALHDQAWQKMTMDEWKGATAPKVTGTWNLHNETQSQDLDFFILFSSLSGIVGQVGQSNYASANTFLDAFVNFRRGKGLTCTSLNIGAVEGAGYLLEDEELLKKMKGTGWRAVQESELLEVLGAVMRRSGNQPRETIEEEEDRDDKPPSNLVNSNCTLVGIAPVIPLSNPNSSATLRKDVRMSVFHNIRSQFKNGASSDGLRKFLSAAKIDPEMLSKPESVALLGQEIGKKLLGLVLQPVDGEIDVSLSLAQLGLDWMVAVEMRARWKQMFGLDISTLEMLSMGTLEALGKQAINGLIASAV